MEKEFEFTCVSVGNPHAITFIKNIEEFDRLQRFMLLVEDKTSNVYKAMKERYITLKVILTASGINLTELDRIKE